MLKGFFIGNFQFNLNEEQILHRMHQHPYLFFERI